MWEDTANVEFVFGTFTAIWGGLRLVPGSHSFDNASWWAVRDFVHHACGPAADVDRVLGSCALVVAALRFWGVIFDVRPVRVGASLLGFSFWLGITLGAAANDVLGTGVGAYGPYTLLNAYLNVRNVLWRDRARE